MSKTKDTIDLAFSFDTTGSMYPCLTQVRRYVEGTVRYLFDEIPQIRIAVVTHGDYCDGHRMINSLDFTQDKDAICHFIKAAPATDGGDSDEAYEAVLNHARTLSWTSGKNKAFVLIGDANPHNVGYSCAGHIRNQPLDWKNELSCLLDMGIKVYPVQALGNSSSQAFYEAIARKAGTSRIELDQFEDVTDIIQALCMTRANKLDDFEKFLRSRKSSISYSVSSTIDRLAGRAVRARGRTSHSLHAVHPSRFQILSVDDDCSIRDFVEDNGLKFQQGRGFYEFTKPVTIQDYKEVIVQDRSTGEMFTGNKARQLLGIPIGVTAKVKPTVLDNYRGFIQSTSVNRKLLANTRFLYEVPSHE